MVSIRPLVIFFPLAISFFTAQSGAVIKAHLFLNEGSYEKAAILLDKQLRKNATDFALNFLMACYYAYSDHPAHSLDSAYFFADIALKNYPGEAKKKQLKQAALAGIRPYTMQRHMQEVCMTAYEKADSLNTLQGWELFIQTFHQAKKMPLAIERRNQLAYEQAMGSFTYESFRDFMESYPNAEQAPEARNLYESLLYKKMTESNTWQAYHKFMKQNPESPFFNEAKEKHESLLFRDLTKDHSLKSYEEYIREHPGSAYHKAAQDSIYAIVTRGGSVFDYQKFIRSYPANRNVKDAWRELFEAYNVKRDLKTLEQFKTSYTDYPFKDELEKEILLAGRALIPFEQNGMYGFMDSVSKGVFVQPQFEEVFPFSEGLAAVVKGDCEEHCLYGYIDKEGTFIVKPKYNDAEDFHNGFAIVGVGEDCYQEKCKYGFINRRGELVAPAEYDVAFPFYEGLALVHKEKRGYGFVDTKGRVRIRLKYQDAGSFSGGYAAVKDTLWGYIDKNGDWKIKPSFLNAGDFSEGLAPVANDDGQWGYIDESGKYVIEPVYAYALPFKNGTARVVVNEKVKGVIMQKERMIDREGKMR